MALSKSTRITIMLAIDVVFFLVELIAGFMVHSLALMADAFHMLNDIISLLVGLWAVNLARKQTTDKFSFGWLRAEILGAFFNAVFLIALCVSIILEALTRFIDPPEISNPVLILVVGCFGLASNIVGFVVLGGHGHSHGPDDHDHDHDHDHSHERTAEEGRADGPYGTIDPTDEAGPATDVLPEVTVARITARGSDAAKRITFENEPQPQSAPERCNSKMSVQSRGRERRRAGSMRHSRLTSIDDISIYPSSFRQDIIAASRSSMEPSKLDDDSLSDDSTAEDAANGGGGGGDDPDHTETSPLLIKRASNGKSSSHSRARSASQKRRRSDCGGHRNHYHSNPDKARDKNGGGGHGHSHGDMGMNAMVLHVLGDALGNVGVIVTALVIWLTDWWWKCYADPAVSLFITVIILKSALPLTFATSKILLQATPDHINVNEIRRDIEMLDGVVSCHHVHIWQLSDTKLVASMHIQVAFPISEGSGSKYMRLAKEARRCLHAYGIHSATIQPEFCLDESHAHAEESQALRLDGADGPKLCLLDCVDDCVGKGCCSVAGSAAGSVAGSARRDSDGSGHSPDSHGSHHH